MLETLRKTRSQSLQDDAHLGNFGKEIESILRRVEADLGEKDRTYILDLCRRSKILEGVGRTLIHFSPEPLSFSLGVFSLWIHKQIETSEIGHMALHGVFERFVEDERLHSRKFRWKFPVDEESWWYAHNMRHHSFTNVAGKDPDIHFGMIRLTPETPHRWLHRFQLPVALFFVIPNFGSAINTHVTGLLDVYLGNGLGNESDFLKDRSAKSIGSAHRKAFRKWLPYYAENYVFYPALAGPFFWKVMLGNYMADKMRDVYTGMTVFCGHVGPDLKSYAAEAIPKSRGEWYAMQIESSQNFKVSRPLSLLCGALDHQIEHHLFPKLPPNRLREIRAEVQDCCERYGVTYRMENWPRTLMKVFQRIADLSRPTRTHS